ncbi:hypothetical protein UPYG_G00017810 [Umbra pygmaea]|uniref:Uncharacterized protein n=1 Tax=Umbra pygmaea TaxID=75934 RepID=A0ABD0XN64_UMBPY
MNTGATQAFIIITACFLQNFLCVCHCQLEEAECLNPGSGTQMYHYKALSGDVFVMQCAKPAGLYGPLYNNSANPKEANWSKTEGESINIDSDCRRDNGAVTRCGNALWFSNVTTKHSGIYTCYTGVMVLHFCLEVLERASLGCMGPEESKVTLTLGNGGKITCPGVKCDNGTALGVRGLDVIWYKGEKSVFELKKDRDIALNGRQIILCNVFESDAKDYFCDYTYKENGRVRTYVNVSVIARDTKLPPEMTYPHGNETEEVDLGGPHTLRCEVQFGFQTNCDPLVQWWVSSHNNHGVTVKLMDMGQQQETRRTIEEFTVIRTAQIPEVTLVHLESTFTCLAQNSIGNSSATVRLQRKPKASVTLVIVGSLVSLLFLVSLGVIMHVYWLEINILYRIYRPYPETTTDEKEFDAFLSFVPSSSSPDVGRDGVREQPLEVLLSRVLEEKWGYRLCLLERDLLPGGAYAEDVMWAIQRSRRLVCLMSPNYMASTRLFELETGIRALHQKAHLQLILIWTNTSPNVRPIPRRTRTTHFTTSLNTSSLTRAPSKVVRSALRVLPALYWNPRDQGRMITSSNSGSRFWRSLRKAMPDQGVTKRSFQSQI